MSRSLGEQLNHVPFTYPVSYPGPPAQTKNSFQGFVDESRHNLQDHRHISCLSPTYSESSSTASSPRDGTLPPFECISTVGEGPWSRKQCSQAMSKDRQVSAANMTDCKTVEQIPVSENPLTSLKWPFDDFLPSTEAMRRGGGGGSQPNSTGTQGFPQFVTAGPGMSLFGNNLFGYDREELMGSIAWA